MRIHCAAAARSVVAVVAIVAIAGCSSAAKPVSEPTSASRSTTPTTQKPGTGSLPAFYTTAEVKSGHPVGTLLDSEVVAAPGIHGTVYRVMYQSLSLVGTLVAVSGIVIVPRGRAPAGGYPVVTWGHGTTGLGDACAPSLDPTSAAPPPTNDLLDQGYEITASDYAGMGTPGVLPYLVGVSAARNVIDIVRAARQLPAAHASTNYVVWGYSEGGQTAMFALDIAATYAPGFDLKGVVAGAPPSQLHTLYSFLTNSPYRYYLLMLVVGLNAAYGDQLAPLDQILTPAGMALVPVIQNGCVSIAKYGLRQPTNDLLPAMLHDVTIASAIKVDPFTIPAWRKILDANDPESFTTPAAAPLLIVQGSDDEEVPAATTHSLEQHECSIGQDVEQWTYPGQSHALALVTSASDVGNWVHDRFSGVAEPDPYVPTALSGIQQTRCSASAS
jgi:hypothetical protein